jgi:hypothetical protein
VWDSRKVHKFPNFEKRKQCGSAAVDALRESAFLSHVLSLDLGIDELYHAAVKHASVELSSLTKAWLDVKDAYVLSFLSAHASLHSLHSQNYSTRLYNRGKLSGAQWNQMSGCILYGKRKLHALQQSDDCQTGMQVQAQSSGKVMCVDARNRLAKERQKWEEESEFLQRVPLEVVEKVSLKSTTWLFSLSPQNVLTQARGSELPKEGVVFTSIEDEGVSHSGWVDFSEKPGKEGYEFHYSDARWSNGRSSSMLPPEELLEMFQSEEKAEKARREAEKERRKADKEKKREKV